MSEGLNDNFYEQVYYEKRVWIQSARLISSIYIFSKPYIGEDDELGRSAIGDILTTLSESEVVPRYIAFWNNAVKVCTEDSKHLSVLNKLEKFGIKILVAGNALDKLNLKSSLRVGKLANHFDLVEAINQVQKVVNF